MIINRNVITASAVIVVFFLVFLGMRISLPEKAPTPKSRPRAVLNLFAKSASSTVASTKSCFAPSSDYFLHESQAHHHPLPCVVSICLSPLANHAVSADVHLPKDRSPPRC